MEFRVPRSGGHAHNRDGSSALDKSQHASSGVLENLSLWTGSEFDDFRLPTPISLTYVCLVRRKHSRQDGRGIARRFIF